MNAAATVQAAIDKLEHLKGGSTPGPWREEDHKEEFVGFIVGDGYKLATEITIIEDGQLIATLHRTIDAQLTILRDALKALTNGAYMAGFAEFVESAFRHELLLASAILGDDS